MCLLISIPQEQAWRVARSPVQRWEPRWRRCHALPEEDEAVTISETTSLREERFLRYSGMLCPSFC